MKRLTILLLVCIFAAVSNAALINNLSLSIDNWSLLFNERATISVISNSLDTGTVYLDIGPLAKKDIQYTLTNAAVTPNAGDFGSIAAQYEYDGAWEYMIQVAASPTGTVTAGVMFNVKLTNLVGIYDPIYFTLFNENMEQVGQTMTIQLIPEPASLALLGLGGLFLRHRRQDCHN